MLDFEEIRLPRGIGGSLGLHCWERHDVPQRCPARSGTVSVTTGPMGPAATCYYALRADDAKLVANPMVI